MMKKKKIPREVKALGKVEEIMILLTVSLHLVWLPRFVKHLGLCSGQFGSRAQKKGLG